MILMVGGKAFPIQELPAMCSFRMGVLMHHLDEMLPPTLGFRRGDLTMSSTNIQNTFNINSELFIPMTGEVARIGLGILPTFGVRLEL